MERDLNNRDFERFVKQNADQYRMFPSENVWKEIHNTLHTRRRWYGIGLALLLLTSAVVTWVMLLPGNTEYGQTVLQPPKSLFANTITSSSVINNNLSIAAGPVQPKPSFNNPFITPGQPERSEPAEIGALVKITTSGINEDTDDNIRPLSVTSTTTTLQKGFSNLLSPGNNIAGKKDLTSPLAGNILKQNLVEAKSIVANDPAEVKTIAVNKPKEEIPQLPVSKEPVAKTATKAGTAKKLSWMLYLTPTVSYRSLSENLQYLSAARYNSAMNGGPAVVYPSDINTMVNHRPDLGFQLGLRTAYPVSKWFSLTGGIQLSVSKYDIKAYEHPAEMTTIALSDRSVSAISKYRNTNGFNENWLRNFYFSASLPIGAELKLSDGNKNYFGIAGTIQPTYVLDNRAYLISADYKNYAEMPSLTRRWNMNTSFELFSAHQTGKVQWRVGPQVRYQLMSSFSKNYPIKEHLFDFGLKLGIQLR